METIYKYHLEIATGEQPVLLPNGFKIIHVGLDPNQDPCVWCLVDVEKPLVKRLFMIVGTGRWLDINKWEHLGSFVDGSFVGHVFINKNTPQEQVG